MQILFYWEYSHLLHNFGGTWHLLHFQIYATTMLSAEYVFLLANILSKQYFQLFTIKCFLRCIFICNTIAAIACSNFVKDGIFSVSMINIWTFFFNFHAKGHILKCLSNFPFVFYENDGFSGFLVMWLLIRSYGLFAGGK